MEKAHGLYNTVPDRAISKYELLELFNKYIRREKISIVPYDGFSADKSLVRTRFEFGYLIPDYEIMVKETADWMRAHKDMYPHYEI